MTALGYSRGEVMWIESAVRKQASVGDGVFRLIIFDGIISAAEKETSLDSLTWTACIAADCHRN